MSKHQKTLSKNRTSAGVPKPPVLPEPDGLVTSENEDFQVYREGVVFRESQGQ